MKTAKIGAVFYALWGLLHVAGGSVMLVAWAQNGGAGVMRAISSGPAAESISTLPSSVGALAAYHSFNLIWLGALVTGVAILLNWNASRLGYWINLILVVAVDFGLLVFQLVPGYIAWADGVLGIALMVPAVVLSTLGLKGDLRASVAQHA